MTTKASDLRGPQEDPNGRGLGRMDVCMDGCTAAIPPARHGACPSEEEQQASQQASQGEEEHDEEEEEEDEEEEEEEEDDDDDDDDDKYDSKMFSPKNRVSTAKQLSYTGTVASGAAQHE